MIKDALACIGYVLLVIVVVLSGLAMIAASVPFLQWIANHVAAYLGVKV